MAMFGKTVAALAALSATPAMGQTAATPAPTPAATPAPAAAPAPPPCSAEEYRQLDFWVGDWVATWTNPDGTKGQGRNRITRDEYGSCVITEHFEGGGLKGHSVSTYLQGAKEWRQTWVDDQAGYFDLFGGPVTGSNQRFVLQNYRRKPTAGFLRMVWEDVTADAFTWRWQKKDSESAQWTDSWVIKYTRAPK